MSDEGMNLTNNEAIALAHLVVARQVHHVETWLEWEDFPYLGQYAFERLTEAVRDLALAHSETSKNWQRINNIDAIALFDEATEGPEVAEHLGGRE